ncbi:hypothetical protein ACXHXG_28890 [Rhizobium sp. LEGMi198b]
MKSAVLATSSRSGRRACLFASRSLCCRSRCFLFLLSSGITAPLCPFRWRQTCQLPARMATPFASESEILVHESFAQRFESNERNLKHVAGTLRQIEITCTLANGVRESKHQNNESEIWNSESNERNLF